MAAVQAAAASNLHSDAAAKQIEIEAAIFSQSKREAAVQVDLLDVPPLVLKAAQIKIKIILFKTVGRF